MSNNEENKEKGTLYEVGFNILPTIDSENVSGEVDKIKEILKNNKAEIVKEGETKFIKLAYTMFKNSAGSNTKIDRAHFGWIKFNSDSDSINKIKEGIDNLSSVLRFLIVKTVDDDEHSTIKLVDLDSEEIEEVEDGVNIDADTTEDAEGDKESQDKKNEEETPEEESEDQLDKAIDDLVK